MGAAGFVALIAANFSFGGSVKKKIRIRGPELPADAWLVDHAEIVVKST